MFETINENVTHGKPLRIFEIMNSVNTNTIGTKNKGDICLLK